MFVTSDTFVVGVRRDQDAVVAGLTLPWNSGPVEGHVNRLKMLKRQMFRTRQVRTQIRSPPPSRPRDDVTGARVGQLASSKVSQNQFR